MKKVLLTVSAVLVVIFAISPAMSAYHHEGESDSPNFLALYPSTAGTKLDHCATCHTGGEYEKKPGKWISLGSCQWCHYSYGYDGSGNIVDTLNPYGKDYWLNGRNQAALETIESKDSDEDGYTNRVEIDAVRYPGNADDDPSKVPAPSRVYTRAQLEALTRHTQFMLMNTSRSGDFYVQYTGVPVEDLLEDAGILATATGITVFAPDGWSNYHPLEIDSDPELYHVKGVYPEAVYYYDTQADTALNPVSGWCDYSAPSCAGRSNKDLIVNPGGLKMILAYEREGQDLEPGVLGGDSKLTGEGPYRLVPPQKAPCPPDQASSAEDQDVTWPYDFNWDHNGGAASRTATIIRIEPLPEGTTDIDLLEAGWQYVDEEKILIYGALTALASYVAADGNCSDHSPCYSSIQTAINEASGTAVLKVREGSYSEDVTLNTNRQIALESGLDTGFTSVSGESRIRSATVAMGTLILKKGKLVVGE
ncbi:MAG: hypothetical protein JRJ09_04210 [Deltaproteobacteria bacterium]|nr:hypothetical protein [Deltaproteobacteria bacterium]MBW2047716.1 hypothetical protein [Deltaproteobacteria bacterium]MBW2111331.1 hypothetical protein [Deltaproteobacteria bacterium]MBW2354498.1 hypothetical protein [Deltaproteobacteria bacterium]